MNNFDGERFMKGVLLFVLITLLLFGSTNIEDLQNYVS
ncbi:hypothetical protein J2S78_000499 [Salibacterium salarium]|nr:hypothetical protein [Salibacterium salarium]